MKRLSLTFIGILFLASMSCTTPKSSQTDGQSAYTSDQVRAIILQALGSMKPPIADIYYYNLYKWELVSHKIQNVDYLGNGKWKVLSHALFNGYHKGLSVGRDTCALGWHFDEADGTVALTRNELRPPQGRRPTLSRPEVIAIVAKHLSDMYYDHAPLNWHDTAHFKLNYLGDGKWEVRVVITNAVGLWHVDEESEVVQFQGRLGPEGVK
jgi:hypothetical protein